MHGHGICNCSIGHNFGSQLDAEAFMNYFRGLPSMIRSLSIDIFRLYTKLLNMCSCKYISTTRKQTY